MELTNQFIFIGALLALLAVLASAVTRKSGAPLLLVFLILGMLAGEDGPGGIKFNDFSLAFLFGSLALAIIILDGGLGARRSTFRVSLKPALSLATFGVVITAAVTGAAAYWLLSLPWQQSLLIGAIVGSTDAAAVFGLLRAAGVELKERAGATLEIESGTNDPMAILLTVTFVQLMVLSEPLSGWALASEFTQQMGLGLLMGFALGYLLSIMLKHVPLSVSLYPLCVLAGALSVFGITNLVGGSGFLAIYIVGAIIGNSPLPYHDDIHRFHDGMAWLSQIGMFLMLGLLITPSNLVPIVLPAILIALVLIFVARPLAVLLSLLPFQFPWREQLFISWCGLRGAVPIILALFPSLAGLEDSTAYFELVFFIVLVSLILQGWTIAPVARWLKVELPVSAKDPEHLTLFMADDQNQELLVYEVVEESQANGMNLAYLPLASGGQLLGVVRNGMLLDRADNPILSSQDRVLILAPYGHSAEFGKVFASKRDKDDVAPVFLGEFIIHPSTRLRELSSQYDIEVAPRWNLLSIGEFLNRSYHGKAVVGDEVSIGSLSFQVREVEGGRIASVTMKLQAPVD
ncbi:potassium/proton antiporter [Aliiglaciecola sp. CAU 1673]|uniref:potassium/proton antiporter n=1 Tax=Aliiglaciecola sp. CAU 1673 TaxID=3032595 RepID=UPI0023D9FC17|nr:potassium/proton antiporter [Aliiglaciecola sp. CAU 1673]MDF2180149.1 potassium/proton antiporter [Aliiglaciecola sp. CAU 1673]